MANLQIKGMDDLIYSELKALASSENRSISQQVLYMLRGHLARKGRVEKMSTPARVLLELSGSWEDQREAEQIVEDLRASRKNSEKNPETRMRRR